MKVLSLKQPFAALVKDKIKCIETRSWKTNYRGEIYIHASKRIFIHNTARDERLIEYLKDKELKYGAIIAKGKLVDCIYMDQKFLSEIEKNAVEKDCGRYEIGRYAWILDDIEELNDFIYTNGQLGIWNYNSD